MKVRIIGCHGGVEPGYQTTCFYIDDHILVDCGSACSALTPVEQSKIEHILITHPHLDHIKDICFVLENTFDEDRVTLKLHSSPGILDDIKTHIMNNIIWPDFSTIPIGPLKNKFLLEYKPFSTSTQIDDYKITQFKANHPGHAVGYLVEKDGEQIVFSGDTGPNHALWKAANSCSNLKAIFTEISFPNRMDGLATAAGHFTLEQLIQDMSQLKNKQIPIYISHFKPLFLQELLDEFQSEAPENLVLMHANDHIDCI